ncbi:MAG: acyl-CoA thioesterase [Anaerolineae bacterium]|nr:acyl-CoA thioesterase [Anaerolineae bacterium]HNS38710.1 acyl-CoA thioesterase [Promineifilum sp.]
MEGRTVRQSRVTLTQIMGLTDANVLRNVHGGVIMKLCDEAGGTAAMRHARQPVVTVAVDSMGFHSPVHIGNLLTVQAEVTWVGHTSLETRIIVTAENLMTGQVTHTNTAYYVYVALDETGSPTAVPPIICETDEERALFDEAAIRQEQRLSRRRHERPINL